MKATQCALAWFLMAVTTSAFALPLRAAPPDGQSHSAAWVSLDGSGWLISTDPKNRGREEKWFTAPRTEARPTQVPWIIQDVFPGYHGVAWYWREFVAPTNPHPQGRCLLRFWQVDYQAEVWLNGTSVGSHEGGESPFTLNVTDVVKFGATNSLAVRVLNPTHQPIDGIVLNETPHRNKALPYAAGSAWNQGGILDSVELHLVPAVRVEDLFVRPGWNTGILRIQANVRNATANAQRGHLEFSVVPAAAGGMLAVSRSQREFAPGDALVECELTVPQHRLWELSDPILYRVTARVWVDGSPSFDEHSVRCGFRDFRFADGCFRLNGRRLFLRSSHTGNCAPIGLELPHDPDLLRRDLLNVKVMGFNCIRFIAGVPKRYQLDLCDEIGLLVYEESYAGWCLADSPRMAARYNESVLGMVRRDRNHPSVVIWGLLNETTDSSVFRHAVGFLPKLRALDDTRLVLLNSGGWHQSSASGKGVGALSNPGSPGWEDVLSDQHPYQHVPHTADVVRKLRTLGGGGKPLFISEYGVGSAVDLWRATRHYERLGATHAMDAQFYRDKLDEFLADWDRWRMAEAFSRPEDFFAASNRRMAGQRLLGLNAIRANPSCVGYSLTGTVDQGMSGEGLFTTFRELKPGTVDAVFDGWAPLRWCLFIEPVHFYRGERVRLEAVLANEDQLAAGDYPARFQVFDPNHTKVWEKQAVVTIAKPGARPEPHFALPVLAEDVVIDGPPGQYRFVASLERGAAPAGGDVAFFIADRAQQRRVETEVVLWGEDPTLVKWLSDRGIATRPFQPVDPKSREVILVGLRPPAPGGTEAFRSLATQLARGSTAVFLCPEVFARDGKGVPWGPLARKGAVVSLNTWLYHKEEWAKPHPIFEGLPTGLMDYTFYREIIPDQAWTGLDAPLEAVAGANDASLGYSSGLLLSGHRFGAGHFILTTLRLREHLGVNPAADQLLLNLLQYAAGQHVRPLAALPQDFEAQLQAVGY
jgi:hypothetical protein